MEKIFIKYAMGAYTYVAIRTTVYAPPLKKEEYMIDRASCTVLYTLPAPCVAPIWVYADLKNLEHVVRKMPGPIDRSPWS